MNVYLSVCLALVTSVIVGGNASCEVGFCSQGDLCVGRY